MAVRPDHQRRGIGRMLMADFEAQVRERGGSTVVLVPDDVDGATTAHGLDLYPEIWRAGRPTRVRITPGRTAATLPPGSG